MLARCGGWRDASRIMLTLLRILILVAIACAAVRPVAAQDYEAGFKAFRAGDYVQAAEIWRSLAESGDVRAQYGLGVLYERGSGDLATDLGRAANWYARAVEQGHPAAQNNLGLMFAQGRGVRRDPARAAELWRSAADSGHLMAQYNLGLAYYRGEGVQRDNRAALRWFRHAGENGLPDGQFAIGQMYRLGVVVDQDNAKALAWYRRAARQGHEKARAQARELAEAGWQAAELDVPAATVEEAAGTSAGPVPPADGASGGTAQSDSQSAGADDTAGDPATPASTVAAGAGSVSVWLGSLRSKAKARQHWDDMTQRFPDALAGADPRYRKVDLGENGTFFRVLAGGFADAAAARRTCEALRAKRASAFCKVIASGD